MLDADNLLSFAQALSNGLGHVAQGAREVSCLLSRTPGYLKRPFRDHGLSHALQSRVVERHGLGGQAVPPPP